MPIYSTDLITLNGSQRCFGGQVYNASYQQGFNGQPSSLDIDVISENRTYSIPDLNFRTPYNIKLGSNINLSLYASKYCIDDGDYGKILRVSFIDGSFKLKRYWIGIKSLYTNPQQGTSSSTSTVATSPVGFLGSSQENLTSQPTQTANQVGAIPACVIPLGKTASELAEQDLPLNQFDSYSYDEFQAATAFLGIPSIPSNKYMTTNMQGTVLDVFNYFMDAYGFSWYWGFDDKIHLIDLKRPITLDDSLLNQFETHSKRLNSQTCTDISNTAARGAVAIEDGDAEIIVLGGATPFWEGHFMGIPFKVTDNKACIAAAMGQEIYFAYMVYQHGWDEAFKGIGYDVRFLGDLTDSKCSAIRASLAGDYSSLYFRSTLDSGGITAEPDKDLGVIVYEPFSESKTVMFDVARKIGELLQKGSYYVASKFPDLDIQWTNVSASALDPNATLTEAVDWYDVLDFDKVEAIKLYGVNNLGARLAGLKSPLEATIREIVGGDIWIITQNPNLVPNEKRIEIPQTAAGQTFSIKERPANTIGIGNLSPTTIGIADYAPSTIPIGYGIELQEFLASRRAMAQAQELAYQKSLRNVSTMFPQEFGVRPDQIPGNLRGSNLRVAIVNRAAKKVVFNFWMPDYSAAKISIKGIAKYKDEAVQQIYNASSRRIVGQSFPVIDDSIAGIDVVSYENLSDLSVDPTDYLSQAAFKRDFPDKTYSCEIRGITLGFEVVPDDGLKSVSIRMTQDGYRSNYELSTQKPKPAAPETFRQKFPIN